VDEEEVAVEEKLFWFYLEKFHTMLKLIFVFIFSLLLLLVLR
jgi:hypothetical protein